MTLAYASKLDLKTYHTNIEAHKIDNSTLKTFEIVLASFQIEDKQRRTRFFQKIFLSANISVELVLTISF